MAPAPTTPSPAELAETYFRSWLAGDFATLRDLLADDVSFRGPLATLHGADDCVAGLQRMSLVVTDIVVHHRFVDGPEVLTWFDLHTSVAPPAPTANWSSVEDGRITRIQVTFDTRALAGS